MRNAECGIKNPEQQNNRKQHIVRAAENPKIRCSEKSEVEKLRGSIWLFTMNYELGTMNSVLWYQEFGGWSGMPLIPVL
jgi:hypothetical protein